MLQALVRLGILKGIRGPRGGYELARERRRITADDILRAAGTVDEIAGAELVGSPLLNEVVIPAIGAGRAGLLGALAASISTTWRARPKVCANRPARIVPGRALCRGGSWGVEERNRSKQLVESSCPKSLQVFGIMLAP